MTSRRSFSRDLLALAAIGASCLAFATEPTDPAGPLNGELMPLAAIRSLMVDVTESASRAVIVGERGHVLVSESRSDWRQVGSVPTRALLTAVTALGEDVWAVGHDQTIMHSADGGLTWELQRTNPWKQQDDPDAEFDPTLGAPLLDVLFLDAQTGFAVGAYSLLLKTADGGKTWEKIALSAREVAVAEEVVDVAAQGDNWTFSQDDLELDEESDPHLNAITRTSSGLLLIVAERGSAFRSRDNGASWERIQLPYDGSMFGAISLGDERILVYGLRGHVLETKDGGTSWDELDSGVELSLMAGAALPGGTGGVVLAGSNGAIVYRIAADSPLQHDTFLNEQNETPVLACALPIGSRTVLLCSDKGTGKFELK